MKRHTVKILGYEVDTFNSGNALDYIYSHGGHVVTINPEIIQFSRKTEELRKIINDAELVIPDGIGVEIGLKILGHNVKRIAGIDFGKMLIEKYSKENKSIAFIGGKPGIADAAVTNLKNEIVNLNAVYIKDGYYDDENVIIDEIIKAKPDLILVALGFPKQEYLISKLKEFLPNSVFIGLGGSFDVWSGNVKRAPKIYQKLCIEWLYRTIKEPKRFKRIFPTLPLFLLDVFIERFTGENYAK